MGFSFVTGDTGSKLSVACINDADGSVIDISGMTVKLLWDDTNGDLNERDMSVVDATGELLGKYGNIKVAEYQFAANELYSGIMEFDVKIIDGSGKVLHSLNHLFLRVRPPLT